MLNLIEIKVKYSPLSNILAPKIPATNFFFQNFVGNNASPKQSQKIYETKHLLYFYIT